MILVKSGYDFDFEQNQPVILAKSAGDFGKVGV